MAPPAFEVDQKVKGKRLKCYFINRSDKEYAWINISAFIARFITILTK